MHGVNQSVGHPRADHAHSTLSCSQTTVLYTALVLTVGGLVCLGTSAAQPRRPTLTYNTLHLLGHPHQSLPPLSLARETLLFFRQ
jgi:hypothetical protein